MFLNGTPMNRLARFQSFLLHISQVSQYTGSLEKTKSHLYLPAQGKERPLHFPSIGPQLRQLLRFHSQWFINSFSVSEQLYAGVCTLQDRLCEDVYDMCIDIGYIVTGENKRAQ